ncbi:MAG TPA: hypothetical protein VM509_08445 [Planctomycetota bacterium]|nr:hypothetical protein [Planctomycetota bacterium]
MLVFSTVGPAEFAFIFATLGAAIGLFMFSRMIRTYRKIDECHSMLMELVHKSHERA